MKKIFLLVAFIVTIWIKPGFAQSSETQNLLKTYYGIKDALVNSDAAAASTQANEFSKALGSIDMKSLPQADMKAWIDVQHALATDAKHLAETQDIAQQRTYFASFSSNLFALAKIVKLSKEPIYYDYCPMKKSYWLSEQAVIKNPYFGKQMLSCGAVKETLK